MTDPTNLFPAIGDLLMERYRIETYIARGGMGVVMQARQLSMDRRVAIKMVLPEFSDNAKTIARFDREVRLAKRLRHPHIVELYDFGATSAGVLYLVMEYLEGEDLKSVLKREQRLPVGRAGQITMQMLDALAEAHAHQIVHRDLKPSNIFITPTRRLGDFAKLLDFGIAKSLAEDASEVTAQGEICGTSAYMSPEVFIQGAVSTSVDVYAMGLILLEMLIGKKVFAGQSSAETLVLHLRKEVVVPEPFAGTALAQVIRKATAKRIRDRYPTALAFLEELEPAVASLDPEMIVSQSAADGYVQDLSTDSALLEQILQGPWASGMTESESGSSDVIVMPVSEAKDDDEFDTAVTQLIALAKQDLQKDAVPRPEPESEPASSPPDALDVEPAGGLGGAGDTESEDHDFEMHDPFESDGAPTGRMEVEAYLDDRPAELREMPIDPTAEVVSRPTTSSTRPAARSGNFFLKVAIIATLVVIAGLIARIWSTSGDEEPAAELDPAAARVAGGLAAEVSAEEVGALPVADEPEATVEVEADETSEVSETSEETIPVPPKPAPPATVEVVSVPPGARVLRDGREVGVTPVTVKFGDVEELELTLEHEGYEPAQLRASRADAPQTLESELTPVPVRESPRPAPKPAKVSVDKIVVPKFD